MFLQLIGKYFSIQNYKPVKGRPHNLLAPLKITFRGVVYDRPGSIFLAVSPSPPVSLETFTARFRRLVLAGTLNERAIEDALTLNVVAFRRKFGSRKTFFEIDGRRVDLMALYNNQANSASVNYRNFWQRCRALKRKGLVSAATIQDALRFGSTEWKTWYGGGRHRKFFYEGEEFPEFVGHEFHGISAFLHAIGRYEDRVLVWARLKAGWSLDDAISVSIAIASHRTGSIYRITRHKTGQVYIGLTLTTVAQRWILHIRRAKSGATTRLAKAIREDGPEGFTVDVLEQGISDPRLVAKREALWAKRLGAFGKFGLNTAPAGGLGSPRGISTKVGDETFRSKTEAAQVLGERHGIASHVVLSRLNSGHPLPDASTVRTRSRHPEAGSNLFRRWLALLRRHNGAVAKRWSLSYDNFKADVSPVPDGLELVRKNSSLPWGPKNFEWLSQKAKVERVHGTMVIVDGTSYPSLKAIADAFGIGESTLKDRIRRQGMTLDEAVQSPLGVTSYRKNTAEIVVDNRTFKSKRQAILYIAKTRGWTEDKAKYRFSTGAY